MKQSTADINKQLETLISDHRKTQKKLAHYILEIDRRKIWRKKGHKSLYDYCEVEFNYSAEDVDEILGEL